MFQSTTLQGQAGLSQELYRVSNSSVGSQNAYWMLHAQMQTKGVYAGNHGISHICLLHWANEYIYSYQINAYVHHYRMYPTKIQFYQRHYIISPAAITRVYINWCGFRKQLCKAIPCHNTACSHEICRMHSYDGTIL